MPRRRRRFSDLDRALRNLNGAEPAAGSREFHYLQFKKGADGYRIKISAAAKLTPAQRVPIGAAILPFNIPVPGTVDDADRYVVALTTRANTNRKDLGLTNLELGYANIVDGVTNEDDKFYPAVLQLYVQTGTTATNSISAVTKATYPRKPGRSDGVPFGRTTATAAADTEELRRKTLSIAARNATGTVKAKSVSYMPEQFGSKRRSLTSTNL